MAGFFSKIISSLLLLILKLLKWLVIYLVLYPLYYVILYPFIFVINKIIGFLARGTVRILLYKKKQIFLTIILLPLAIGALIIEGMFPVGIVILGFNWWIIGIYPFNKKSKVNKEGKTSIDTSNKGLDEALILASFAAIQNGVIDTETDEAVLAAFQRFSSKTQDLESTQNYLNGLSEDQITGVVSNVKGILHEVEFVNSENMDGDSITAEMFQEANHKGFDVVMNDSSMGATWEAQLKTTDNPDYVQEWIKQYPDGEILVSQEIADKLGLETSGFSNQELTVRVEDFIDQLTSTGVFSSVWGLFPTLPLISALVVLYQLRRRYKAGDISKKRFVFMSIKITGVKTIKFAFYMILMSIWGLNILVGAFLAAKLFSFISTSGLSVFGINKNLSPSDYLKPLNQISGRATA